MHGLVMLVVVGLGLEVNFTELNKLALTITGRYQNILCKCNFLSIPIYFLLVCREAFGAADVNDKSDR